MIEKIFLIENADPVIFYGVNNCNIHAIKNLLPKLKIVARGNAVKCIGDEEEIARDLDNNWEVLAEPFQTVMRRYGIPKPYEKLKALTRGQKVNAKVMEDFIETLDLPEEVKASLRKLTPATYIGLAAEFAENV